MLSYEKKRHHENICEFHQNVSEGRSGVLGSCYETQVIEKETYINPNDFIFRLDIRLINFAECMIFHSTVFLRLDTFLALV